jgi:hypothetical protein
MGMSFEFYNYDGILMMASGYPMAQVKYTDGLSTPMPIGNCIDYADIFDGEVIQCT